MNMKKLAFFLLLTVIFPVTILVSATAITLRTVHDFVNSLAVVICEVVDKVADWADK